MRSALACGFKMVCCDILARERRKKISVSKLGGVFLQRTGLFRCFFMLAVVTLVLAPVVRLMKRSVAEKGAHIGH
jgi:hypothetical protein